MRFTKLTLIKVTVGEANYAHCLPLIVIDGFLELCLFCVVHALPHSFSVHVVGTFGEDFFHVAFTEETFVVSTISGSVADDCRL